MTRIVPWPTLGEVESSTSVESVLSWNRFLPSPRNDQQVKIIDAVIAKLTTLRAADPGAFTAASKNLGWD